MLAQTWKSELTAFFVFNERPEHYTTATRKVKLDVVRPVVPGVLYYGERVRMAVRKSVMAVKTLLVSVE